MELFGDSGLQRMNSRFITANELSTIWCGLIMNFTSYPSSAIANSAMHIQAHKIRVFLKGMNVVAVPRLRDVGGRERK